MVAIEAVMVVHSALSLESERLGGCENNNGVTHQGAGKIVDILSWVVHTYIQPGSFN